MRIALDWEEITGEDMSTKLSIYYHSQTDTHLYEEAFWGDSQSPAFIGLKNPVAFSVAHEESVTYLKISLEAEVMDDKLAVAWVKHRDLLPKTAVGKEFGGPDCEYE